MIPPIKVHCQQKQPNRRPRPHPHQIRVLNSRRNRLTKRRTQCISKQEQTHDQGAHVLGRSCISEFVRCDIAEAFGEGAERDVGDLQPDGKGRDTRADGAACGCVAARGGLVDAPLDDGADDGGDPGECEAECDAGYASEFDFASVKCGVDDVAEERDGNDDGQGVEVVEEVVWGAVCVHG